MVTPRRPPRTAAGRPVRGGRPASAGVQRRSEPEPEPAEGEELVEQEEEQKRDTAAIVKMVGLGAGILISILIVIMILRQGGSLMEVENLSNESLKNVLVRVNGVAYRLRDLRPNEIDGARVKPAPGNDVEVEYDVPMRGRFTKRLPKTSLDGLSTAPDFLTFKGRFRIRLDADGIHETEY